VSNPNRTRSLLNVLRLDDRFEGFATVDELDAALMKVLAQT